MYFGDFLVLGFADEFFAATGAADIDLSLVAGDADPLFAVGATEVSVVPILQPCPEIEPLLVLCLSAVDVTGEHAVKGKDHNACIHKAQEGVQSRTADQDI